MRDSVRERPARLRLELAAKPKIFFRYQKTIEYFNAVHRVEMLARRDMLMGLMVTWARVESW